ncbi:LysR family transcriptional regulator [Viridibacterium curvum]|uniref:LysR family transcriptional regulator n=1 Tax=Viridibacterium curvum TaxID=1101404 RepID=A0ABP9QJA8_9RHOO
MGAYSLDQFLVFIAVVDCGGFAAAARKLGRAQSAITYAIRALEEQTGLVLFDRAHYRPRLTDAGRALLPRARLLVEDLDDFHRHAEGFAHGVEAAISVVINEFVDQAPLIGALDSLRRAYPSVRVRIALKPFGEDIEMVRSGQATLGVVAAIASLGNEFEARQLVDHSLVAVAAPGHPLAAIRGPIGLGQLRGQMQIVWTRNTTVTDSADLGVHALDAWHITDLNAKLQMLRAGVGWGSMPAHMVQEDLAAGRLCLLDMESWEGRDRMPSFSSFVIRLKRGVPGPAARHLVDALLERGGVAK